MDGISNSLGPMDQQLLMQLLMNQRAPDIGMGGIADLKNPDLGFLEGGQPPPMPGGLSETIASTTPQAYPESTSMGIPGVSPIDAAKYGYDLWQQSRGFPQPATPPPMAVSHGPSMECPNEGGMPPMEAPTPPTPPPSGAPGKISQSIAGPGAPSAPGGYGYSPSVQYDITSQGLPKPPQLPKPPEQPGAEMEVAMGGGYAQPSMPTEESLGVKPPSYFEQSLKDRMNAFPKSREAALESVGRDPREFQLEKKSFIRSMFEGMMQGAAGIDRVAMRDKEQARLRDIELKELEFAFKKFNHEDQVRAAQFMYEKEVDTARRVGLLQQAQFALQNVPPNFGDNPQDAQVMAQIYGALGAGYRLPQPYVQEILNRAWDPKKGKYNNLYLTASQRMELEWKAKAESMKRMVPGFDDEVYADAAVNGKWPEWAGDIQARIQREMQKNLSNPTRVKELQKLSLEITNMQNLWKIKNYNEFVDSTKGLDEMHKKHMKAYYANQVMGGPKETATFMTETEKERIKGEFDVLKEQVKDKGSAKPGEAAEAISKRMDTETKLRMYFISLMSPKDFINLGKDAYDAKNQQAEYERVLQQVQMGQRPTPEDALMLTKAMKYQWTLIAQLMPQTAAEMLKTGTVPTTPQAMKELHDKAVRNAVWKGIDDETYAKVHGLSTLPGPSGSRPTKAHGSFVALPDQGVK